MHPILKTEFIYAESRTTLEGSAFILQLQEPFLIGTVLTFTQDGPYLSAIGSLPFWFATVPGYRIIVHITGSLTTGKRLSITHSSTDAMHDTAQRMAEYFLMERTNRMKYYEKFKIEIAGRNAR